MTRKRVLNVGGNLKSTPIPSVYDGWEHVLLDIDPSCRPDIVCDARQLTKLPRASFDAVYCSHNLEHFYRHEVPEVLNGIHHVLKDDAFAHVIVPDVGEVMRTVVQRGLDIDDCIFESPAGPIAAQDVLFGLGVQLERSGHDYFAHKTGFTHKSLTGALKRSGFSFVCAGCAMFEVVAYAFKNRPTEHTRSLLNLPAFDQPR